MDVEDTALGQGAEHVFVALGRQGHLAGEHLSHLPASCQAVVVAAAVVVEAELERCSIRRNTVGRRDNQDSQGVYCWAARTGLEGSLQGEARTRVGVRNVHSWDPAVRRKGASVAVLGVAGAGLGQEAHWERPRLLPPSWDCTSCVRAGPLEAAGIRLGPFGLPFCLRFGRFRGQSDCSAASVAWTAAVLRLLRVVAVVQASVPLPGTSDGRRVCSSG